MTALKLSGLEPLIITKDSNFINIGERTNVTGSRQFLRLIEAGDFHSALEVARHQVEGGAQILDVNFDEALIDGKSSMVRFLNLLASEPDIARVPVMIDSSRWEIIEAGLQVLQGKGIVNSISLKEGEEVFLQQARAIRRYGAAMVVMAFDEKGQADSFQRRIEIAQRCYTLLKKQNIPSEDILFDLNIFPVGTGLAEHADNAVAFFQALRWVRENLPGVSLIGGVSNVSFAFRGNDTVREAMHSVFLYHAIKSGMGLGIVNPHQIGIYDTLEPELRKLVEDVVLNSDPLATERLLEYASSHRGSQKKHSEQQDWRALDLQERLNYALVKGQEKYIEQDVAECLKQGQNPLDIIETSLMEGMGIVGDLFAQGKMFLPQVVKSARVMKRAVAYLQPMLLAQKSAEAEKKGKILLATVKGDVHDIGKNIVGVVLGCNNYDVVDLGVMVPLHEIIQQAKSLQVDAVGLSGLITPSLEEMKEIAREMQRQNLNIPLLIGGATTSRIHTAVKLAPEYPFQVVHVNDASRAVSVVSSLIGEDSKRYRETVFEEYTLARESFLARQVEKKYVSIAQARAAKPMLEFTENNVQRPTMLGTRTLELPSLCVLEPYIDWTPFFRAWDLHGKFPQILSDEVVGEQARSLMHDARRMLEEITSQKLLQAKAVFGIYPAFSTPTDDIVVLDALGKPQAVFHTLRQQSQRAEGKSYLALSDFIAPQQAGVEDYIGCFALSAGFGAQQLSEMYQRAGDDYNAIMVKALADRLAEAFAEYLHEKIRKDYWGYAKEESLSAEHLIEEKYRGIRPAPGYPACPDHREKETLWNLMKVEQTIGLCLTDSLAMFPTAAVSGYYFAHPQARYFGVGRIGKDQVEDYALRAGITTEDAERYLSANLAY